MSKILRYLACLFMLIFAGNALAAGYSCPSYKKYTSCASGYYMTSSSSSTVCNTTAKAGNACRPCSVMGSNYTCSGGTACPKLNRVTCSAGYYLKANATSCSACGGNNYYCPGGTYNVSSSAQGRNTVSSGYYSTGGTSTTRTGQSQCTGATYCASGVQNSCPGSYTANTTAGKTSASQCQISVSAGKYIATANSSTQSTCAAGRYKAAHTVNYGSTSSCSTCGAGTYSSSGAASCTACSGSTQYQNETGQSSCKTVSAGYYKSSNSAQAQCPSGYRDGAGAANINGCEMDVDAGHYVATANSSTQSTCAGGRYKAAHTVKYGSTSSCSTCGVGTYSSSGAASCTACSGSTQYQNETGQSSCKTVSSGYYKSSNSAQAQCPSGYRDGAGAANQNSCVGSFTKTGSQQTPSMQTGCVARTLGTCTPGTCTYTKQYSGTIVSDCTPTNCTKPQTCTSADDNYYLSGGSAAKCSSSYPYSDGGNISSSYCYKYGTKTGSQVNGSVPANCASVTSWTACTPGSCTYKDYQSATDTTCTPTNCTKTVAAVTANAGYYDNGTTCPACSSVGDGTYKLSAAGNDGGSSKCYKNCTRACTKQTCPANATCTHGSQTTSGTQYYGGSCSAAASTCTLSFTCNAGYVKNSAGTACEAATYTITYKNGGGTGADQTQNVKYKANFTTKAANTFTRPGYTFKSWGGSYPNASSDYVYNTTDNTTLTAQWTACASNPTGAGTCSCGPTQYPNGSGCSNCSVSCSSVSGFTLGTYNVCNSQTNSVCYRNCTTADVANSTAVSGTVTKGGTRSCAATSCAANYYLSGSGCAACVPNATCPGGGETFECNDGYHLSSDGRSCEPDEYTITLKKNGGSGTVNGSTGTNDAVQTCKHGQMCTLPDGSGLTRNGYAFTGWGTSAGCTSGIFQETFTSAATRYACWSANNHVPSW